MGGQSRVQVVVEPLNRGRGISQCRDYKGRVIHIGDPGSLLSYGAFPLREVRNRGNTPQSQVRGEALIGVSLALYISFPVGQAPDVASAFWAWETFGGIGGRTRRGFGAFQLTSCVRNGASQPVDLPLSERPTDVGKWLVDKFTTHVVGTQWHPDVPHLDANNLPSTKPLPNGFAIRQQNFDDFLLDTLTLNRLTREEAQPLLPPLVAWYYPLYRLQQFRQNRRRSESSNSPFGRSYWLEPDEIRARTVGFRGHHNVRLTSARKFPRAIFGLPIVFKFKDEAVDPTQTTLQGMEHDRLSSRLILRPIACANGSYVAAATVLAAPLLPPGGLKLHGARDSENIDGSPLTRNEANFRPLNGNPDVIGAYLKTL